MQENSNDNEKEIDISTDNIVEDDRLSEADNFSVDDEQGDEVVSQEELQEEIKEVEAIIQSNENQTVLGESVAIVDEDAEVVDEDAEEVIDADKQEEPVLDCMVDEDKKNIADDATQENDKVDIVEQDTEQKIDEIKNNKNNRHRNGRVSRPPDQKPVPRHIGQKRASDIGKEKHFNVEECSDEELEELVELDDPKALVEKGKRALVNNDIETANMYFTFASVLGNADGLIERAKQLEMEGALDEAYDHYMRAYEKGMDSILPHIVELVAISNAPLAQEILTATALEGNVYCILTLIEKCKQENNLDDLYFWESKLQEYERYLESL